MKKGFWTTKDGDVLRISKMKTSHIQNCITMLYRNMPEHENDEWIEADFPESMDYLMSCFLAYGSKSYKEKIKEFEKELNKRK